MTTDVPFSRQYNQTQRVMVEHDIVSDYDGSVWIEVFANGFLYDRVGPFGTEGEARRAAADMQEMVRQAGGFDIPNRLS